MNCKNRCLGKKKYGMSFLSLKHLFLDRFIEDISPDVHECYQPSCFSPIYKYLLQAFRHMQCHLSRIPHKAWFEFLHPFQKFLADKGWAKCWIFSYKLIFLHLSVASTSFLAISRTWYVSHHMTPFGCHYLDWSSNQKPQKHCKENMREIQQVFQTLTNL